MSTVYVCAVSMELKSATPTEDLKAKYCNITQCKGRNTNAVCWGIIIGKYENICFAIIELFYSPKCRKLDMDCTKHSCPSQTFSIISEHQWHQHCVGAHKTKCMCMSRGKGMVTSQSTNSPAPSETPGTSSYDFDFQLTVTY